MGWAGGGLEAGWNRAHYTGEGGLGWAGGGLESRALHGGGFVGGGTRSFQHFHFTIVFYYKHMIELASALAEDTGRYEVRGADCC